MEAIDRDLFEIQYRLDAIKEFMAELNYQKFYFEKENEDEHNRPS